MRVRRLLCAQVLVLLLYGLLWEQEAIAFDGCHELEWFGMHALWIGLYPDLPIPICKNNPVLEVNVRQRFGMPGSPTGCVPQQTQCYSTPGAVEVEWHCSAGGGVVDSCYGKKQVWIGWEDIGLYTVGCSLPPPPHASGLFPDAVPIPADFKVVVYEMYSVTVTPTEVRPGNEATVQAMIVPGTPFVTINFSVENAGFDAGHVVSQHSAPRPKGYVENPQGTTDRLCIGAIIERTYHAPEVSGENKVKATVCGNDTKEATVKVKIPNLVALGTGNGYNLIGATPKHPDGWYVTPGVRTKLQTIAGQYFAETQQPLNYNDASLVWGGLFDIDGSWGSPHSKHREGKNIDVRYHGMSNQARFQALVAQHGTWLAHGSPLHYHLTFPN